MVGLHYWFFRKYKLLYTYLRPRRISETSDAYLVPCSSATTDVSHLVSSYSLSTERSFLVGKAAGA